MAILLGAARYLAETRAFAGTAALIFQPSEELSGGGRVMVEEGIMERFGIGRVFALHNAPDLEFGRIATRPGPLGAAADEFDILIEGRGGHAAYPHLARDPLPAALALGQGLQAMPGRRVDPIGAAVVSLTVIEAGEATNVIPQTVRLAGTVRTLDEGVRTRLAGEIRRLAEGIASAHGCTARIDYRLGYPVMANDAGEAAFAARVAAEIVGEGRVDADCPPQMGAEDFSYMLNARPGAMVMLGTGPDRAFCHHPAFDYNDEASPIGASWFARLVERALPP